MKVTNHYFEILRDKFSVTDGSIESFRYVLDALIMSAYLDREDVRKHNELMFSSLPGYIHRSFEDIELLEITIKVLDSGRFSSFGGFCSFIGFIAANDSFAEMVSCFKGLDMSNRILAVEGRYAADFSERYRVKTDTLFNELSVNDNNKAQFLKLFPDSQSLYSGEAICRLIAFLDEKKEESYLLFRSNVISNYQEFDISTIDRYHDHGGLEDFCITIDEFCKAFATGTSMTN